MFFKALHIFSNQKTFNRNPVKYQTPLEGFFFKSTSIVPYVISIELQIIWKTMYNTMRFTYRRGL